MATAGSGEHLLSGPPLTEAELAAAERPLAPYFVQLLAAHGDRLLQVVGGRESRADWILRQAAAELSALRRAVPALKEGDTVALVTRRSVHFLPAMVAVVCSGAVCGMVNGDLPLENMRRALLKLNPVAVLSDQVFAESAANAKPDGCPLQVLGTAEPVPDAQQLLQSSAEGLRRDNAAPALALLTSGTTGQPKDIRIPRRNIALMMHLLSRSDAPFGRDDVMLYTTGFYWISGNVITLWCLCTGMKGIAPEDFSPQALLEDIEKYKPTCIGMPPNQWTSLVRHSPEGRLRAAMQQVRVCLTGGAALNAERQLWLEERTGRPFTQWYGQTEAMPVCNLHANPHKRPPPGSGGSPDIGIQAKVLDLETGKTLGPGIDGEVCFKGWSVIKDFADEDGWIHTGDVGQYDADGNLFIVDRIKELVKYRGHHVMPSELEAWLLGHPQVSEAVVVGLPHDEDQEHPVAFVVMAQGATVTPDELKQLVKDKAAGSDEKLLRGGVFVLDSIPRVPNGKVSRGQLLSILQERIARKV